MQGYIIRIQKVSNEDLIVCILSQHALHETYRFYGARHSVINLGYKIDYEMQYNHKGFLPTLRDVTHLGLEYNADIKRMYIWQNFVKLFYPHLKDAEELDDFYYNLLEQCSLKILKQNPKRVCIEAYIKLLHHEGRLFSDDFCFLCETKLNQNISLARAFLFACPTCLHSYNFSKNEILKLLTQKSSLHLNDTTINKLWEVLLEGL